MRIRVGDISKINELSLLKNDSFDTILYLDTSNLTENKVDTLQKIDLSIDKLPSRAKRKVRKNTILFSNVRPIQRHYGLLEETPNNLIVSTGFTTLNPDDSVIDEYFLYYLLTQDSTINYLQMIAENSVSSYPSITSNDIADLNFVIPDSIEEQKRTVKIIKLIDQKISLNNQINEELEAMAKTLYDYWFVQFDFPNENGKPYKSSGGKMVYNDQLKREIPEGWGVKQLGELSTYVTDKISSNDLNSKNYIGTDNMLSNMKGIEQATYLPNSTLVNSFIPNDILIANIRPYFKKIWISDRTGGCSSDVLCLRANDKEICNYLFYSLARDDFFNYNVAGSKGSKMPRGDKAHIQKYSVLFSEKHALKFSKLVSNFISQKHLIYKQNQELTQLRDWLLPMLMNGQVKVEE
ncbi:restriction endonuclease subunit S [Streptococcus sp. A27]|uniref:restriction endonuclease subunit S n=1 Tax=unclassified Streptococcus TaxID=2608887 RepID=UPI00374CC3B0